MSISDISQAVGIAWIAAGSPGKAPTKDCRHSPGGPWRMASGSEILDWLETHTQKQCPHCGLWSIWEPRQRKNLRP